MTRALLILLSVAAVASAQDVSATLVSGSSTATLPAQYAFAATPEYGSAQITVRLRNGLSSPIMIAAVAVNTGISASATASPDFTVTGWTPLDILTPSTNSSFEDVTLTFSPQSMSPGIGYLQVTYQVQTGGCSFTSSSPATQCAGQTLTLSALQGTASAPQIVVSNGGTPLQPGSGTPLNFGNVSLSASKSLTFTLAKQTNSNLTTPAISLQTTAYSPTAFRLDTTSVPANLGSQATGTFTVTFQPGQVAQATATLLVGTESFALSGTGVALTSIDDLTIQYVGSTGVRTIPQPATPI
jgi:hypothetical protein